MQNKSHNYTIAIPAFGLFILASLACQVAGLPIQMQATPVIQTIPITQVVTVTEIMPALNVPLEPEIILQRLNIIFPGQDGKKVIGSGCPGTDGKGRIVDYHFVVGGMDENKEVQRVLLQEIIQRSHGHSPALANSWALDATNLGNGIWEIFIAPSLPSKTYTMLFFHTDATLALGMVNAE
jgi:hypothetical protein